jgi:hypothetical protein
VKTRCICDTLVVCLLLVAIVSLAGGATARRESILAWDQADSAECLGQIQLLAGRAVAVGFVAPPWARSVIRMDVFFTSCCLIDVGPPPMGILPFEARVWAPNTADPTEPGVVAGALGNLGWFPPEHMWVELAFPGGVSIDDPEVFPDGRFYVGIKWLHRLNPCVGWDASEPDGMTQMYDWYDWGTILDGDAMIRAVVSDQPGTPIGAGSWSRVKALYR